jgi:hypothetical protein
MIAAPPRSRRRRVLGLLAWGAALLPLASAVASGAGSRFERTEERADCDHHDPLRQPFFGDLHVHSSYSFDSYVSRQRNDPWAAYAYARGEPIQLPDPDGEQSVVARIRRPLDFSSVTDHAEFLGEMQVCTADAWSLGYWTPLCLMTRSHVFFVQLLAARRWVDLGVADEANQKERSYICSLPGVDCRRGMADFWDAIQQAAEEHYDRTSACSFTTFVGYEYTDAPNLKNLHRNVIFRNQRVVELPISTYDTGTRNVPELWRRLRAECIEGDEGCDVLSIPHNPNLSAGLMFPDPRDDQEARERLFFEPVVEMIQHKAGSECRFDRLAGRGVDTEDELCSFEQNRTDNLASLGTLFGEMRTERGMPVPIDRFGRRNLLRNVLKDGLVLERRTGINPFKMGFIGSTDTHSATPGGTMEDGYVGHLGQRDAGYRNLQDHYEDNPGGLAVVWAEENSRDSIFEGIRRKETYATSGTRPILRFFGGWELEAKLCGSADRIQRAYAAGVPMGGDLPRPPPGRTPSFLVAALKDPGTDGHAGTDLQRVQLVKGWVDADGRTHERVFEVAGTPDSDAGVDGETCEPVGAGHAELCAVWEDPDFDPGQPSFYYARVLENPTCRWSTLQCMAAGVNPFDATCTVQAEAASAAARERGARGEVYRNCCLDEAEQPFLSPVIQERAWSSPIWYRPAGG